ncbi:pseudouridine synthase [Pedobacter sp. UBA4863]|uniref:pseudouridine synthase n=1 Tax=Pedobacter sp. UBA4863 TaxID=1947060 RepID=UPI0025CD179E|nr:pseudouridine synthase [Pedobacter sp. UBA4863]
MTNSNKGKSRDDKSKPGKSTTGRRSSVDSDKPKRFSGKDESKSRSFEAKDRRDSKYSKGDDFKPRSTRSKNSSEEKSGFQKSFDKKDFKGGSPKGRDFQSRSARPRKDANEATGFQKSFEQRESKPWNKQDSSFSGRGNTGRDENASGKRSYVKKDNYAKDGAASKFSDRKEGGNRYSDHRPFRKREDSNFKYKKEDKGERVAPTLRGRKNTPKGDDDLIRLNRYIANSGVCSRRKADELIEAGVVSVNGVPVTELGHKVNPYKDEVRYNGELLKREKKVYVLLNKPKDYITTTEDPQERKTVMHLVEKASRERIYPVGRLDRNTTGLLLMTNDGELADRLSHPRNGITKIYQVELSKNLVQGDFNKIEFGLELEDGFIKPDNISYVTGGSKKEIGIQIHSGKNRIVRRIFEHLGYDVVKLDRVVYGNLTKKDLPRGKWRFLEEHELVQIKHLIK